MATHFDNKTRENSQDSFSPDVNDTGFYKISNSWVISIRVLILAVITTILTNTDLVPFLYRNTNESFFIALKESQHHEVNHIFILIAYYSLFSACIRSIKRGRKISMLYVLLASVFAFFMVEGQRYAGQDTVRSFIISVSTVCMYLIVMASWVVVFLAALILLDELPDYVSTLVPSKSECMGRVSRHLSKHIFLYTFLLLLLILVPVSLIAFPGQFMGDTPGIIAQGYNIRTYKPYWSLEEGGIKLGNHHPVTYTLLLHYCIVVGKDFFNSYNCGIYLIVLIQVIMSASAFAYCIMSLYQSGAIRLSTAYTLACCYGLNVQVQTYLVLISKDALYGAALLFFLTSAFQLCHNKQCRSTCILFVCSIFCCILFRNDGIYVTIPTLIALLTQKGSRRISAVLLPVIVVFWLAFSKVLLPLAGVAPGSKREMLSIPFQQTARCLVIHSEDVTESEKAAIDGVLVFDEVAAAYDPNISDPVKVLYREEATGEEISRYFETWKSMFVKHPATYVYALLNNKFKYFYPDPSTEKTFSFVWSEEKMETTNQFCEELGTDFHHPVEYESERLRYETIRDSLARVPLIGDLVAAPIYLWTSLFLLIYTLRRRNWNALVLLVPVFMIFLINLAGPTNGNYFRYTYPIMLCMPIILASTVCFTDIDIWE